MKISHIAVRILTATFALAVAANVAHADPKKVLFFSDSQGFEHDVIKQKGDELGFAQKILKELGEKNNIEFTFTKDGRVFTPENIAKYDAFMFYTTGVLTKENNPNNPRDGDHNPPMTPEGKEAFLQAIHDGKGFVAVHSATDTFHLPVDQHANQPPDKIDPYIKMLGAEFLGHADQQRARQIVVDKNFPGISAVPDDFGPLEEWYSLRNFAPDLHVILVQDTSKMKKTGNNRIPYNRPDYPSTFAHMYGQGRVFYSSMGHRNDVWTNPVFQSVVLGGLNWALHNVDADITPNMDKVTPEARVLQNPAPAPAPAAQ